MIFLEILKFWKFIRCGCFSYKRCIIFNGLHRFDIYKCACDNKGACGVIHIFWPLGAENILFLEKNFSRFVIKARGATYFAIFILFSTDAIALQNIFEGWKLFWGAWLLWETSAKLFSPNRAILTNFSASIYNGFYACNNGWSNLDISYSKGPQT